MPVSDKQRNCTHSNGFINRKCQDCGISVLGALTLEQKKYTEEKAENTRLQEQVRGLRFTVAQLKEEARKSGNGFIDELMGKG